jgi:biotin-(acetyl-CoA carboxylase) ligase
VLGIGINVARGSVPPESELHFPATSVEQALGKSIDRWNLLKDTLEEILGWLPSLDQIEFLENWEKNLAYKKEWVRLINEGSESVEGRLMGLEGGGSLRLELTDGNSRLFQVGEVHLRAVDRK